MARSIIKFCLYLTWRLSTFITPQLALTLLGLWCLVTPLLLWVAWTKAIFLFILGSGLLACALFCIISIAVARSDEP